MSNTTTLAHAVCWGPGGVPALDGPYLTQPWVNCTTRVLLLSSNKHWKRKLGEVTPFRSCNAPLVELDFSARSASYGLHSRRPPILSRGEQWWPSPVTLRILILLKFFQGICTSAVYLSTILRRVLLSPFRDEVTGALRGHAGRASSDGTGTRIQASGPPFLCSSKHSKLHRLRKSTL